MSAELSEISSYYYHNRSLPFIPQPTEEFVTEIQQEFARLEGLRIYRYGSMWGSSYTIGEYDTWLAIKELMAIYNGPNVVYGTSGNDHLLGLGGNDIIDGGSGNDIIDGGSGIDSALYGGLHSQYQFELLSNGSLQVTDLRNGSPDGTDMVSNVELFQFADVTLSTADTTAPGLKPISPDGSFRMTLQDVSNQFSWSQQESSFDPQGHIKTALVRYDNGSVQGATFDAAGNQPWTSQNSVANAAGQTTNLGVIYDDHTQQTAIFDTTGQLWTSQNAVYDAQGRQTTLGVIYDDGHTEAAVFDADGSHAWTSQSLVFDPRGQLIATSVFWDDGHRDDWHIV